MSGRETVVLVEDEDALRELFARVLEASGYTVLRAGSGEEALELIQRHGCEVDLLLTDVYMPGIKGTELGGHVQQRCPDIPILFTSGCRAEEILDARDTARDGAAFIQKPFSAKELRSKVRAMLDVDPITPSDSRTPNQMPP